MPIVFTLTKYGLSSALTWPPRLHQQPMQCPPQRGDLLTLISKASQSCRWVLTEGTIFCPQQVVSTQPGGGTDRARWRGSRGSTGERAPAKPLNTSLRALMAMSASSSSSSSSSISASTEPENRAAVPPPPDEGTMWMARCAHVRAWCGVCTGKSIAGGSGDPRVRDHWARALPPRSGRNSNSANDRPVAHRQTECTGAVNEQQQQ